MPEKIHYINIQLPREKPATCDKCPLLGTLPKTYTREKSKYVRICCHNESYEYISNRGSHQKRGKFCPFDTEPTATAEDATLNPAPSPKKAKQGDTYARYSGQSYAITMPAAEMFGLYVPPKQLTINI